MDACVILDWLLVSFDVLCCLLTDIVCYFISITGMIFYFPLVVTCIFVLFVWYVSGLWPFIANKLIDHHHHHSDCHAAHDPKTETRRQSLIHSHQQWNLESRVLYISSYFWAWRSCRPSFWCNIQCAVQYFNTPHVKQLYKCLHSMPWGS